MHIVVPVKFVPDLVEELEIDESGTALDTTWLRLMLSEFDDHAIEQAILLKEAGGGQVTVVAPDVEDADAVLFTAAAKGTDRQIKLTGDFEEANNHALARAFIGVPVSDMDIVEVAPLERRGQAELHRLEILLALKKRLEPRISR